MSEYFPLLNLLVLVAIPFLVRLEHRLTKLETKIESGFCREGDRR
jgi:hypothetical protein